ncbi:MAG TPA: hypothetical protein VHZ29_06685 [Rhizomicrobium sp.]|jgi:hypothetical protein|nr:hypothetical protein [Rhizomicrobium sp.]
MIIHDFHVPGIAVTPPEIDSPLIVDTNAVSARPIAFQAFQAVSRPAPKVINRNGCIHGKNGGRPLIGKASDHGKSVP